MMCRPSVATHPTRSSYTIRKSREGTLKSAVIREPILWSTLTAPTDPSPTTRGSNVIHFAAATRIQLGRTLLIFTGDEDRQSSDVLEDIDIVARDAGVAESRIIKSIRQEQGQQILTEEEADEHPWLARTRSNLDVMYHTALAASHTLDIHQLLQRIMELVFEWVEAESRLHHAGGR